MRNKKKLASDQDERFVDEFNDWCRGNKYIIAEAQRVAVCLLRHLPIEVRERVMHEDWPYVDRLVAAGLAVLKARQSEEGKGIEHIKLTAV